MHEQEIKEKIKKNDKLDSFTIGTPKSGAIKLYFDLATMNDEEAEKICRRAHGLWVKLTGGQ